MVIKPIGLLMVVGGWIGATGAETRAQVLTRVSLDSDGNEFADNATSPSISSDGRFITFELGRVVYITPFSTRLERDVYVHDRQTGTTWPVSLDAAGSATEVGGTYDPAISADGRFVAFESPSCNLDPADANGATDVFVCDLQTGVITRVSVDSAGLEGNGGSTGPAISADGRWVAFASDADNLVASDANSAGDVFVHDRETGSTSRVSVDSAGLEADSWSMAPSISADGRIIAFHGPATDLVAGDANGRQDVFVHDRETGATERVSVDSFGLEGDQHSDEAAISADGRYVAFSSGSSLVSADTGIAGDVFVHDRETGATSRISVGSSGTEGNADSFGAAISGDGRFVAFSSSATNLTPHGGGIWYYDAFLHDRTPGTTTCVSSTSGGAESNSFSYPAAMSADGRLVAFQSNLKLSGDRNGASDILVYGPWLTLQTESTSVAAGETLALAAWTGQASGATLLVVVAVNGVPTFVPVIPGAFDARGTWTASAVVPPGLTGIVITCESYGVVGTGKVDRSNRVTIAFE